MMKSNLTRRGFLQLGAVGAGAILGGRRLFADVVPDSVQIDVRNILHPLPAHRGVMWQFRESLGNKRGFDGLVSKPSKEGVPDGESGAYGSLVDARKEHVELAAQTGVNTIRCGVNHSYLEDPDVPGKYNEEAFSQLEKVFDWCGEYKVQCIFDLHGAIGREYGGDPRLWTQKELQDRFCGVWRKIVERFKGHPQIIAWEPLNEPEPRHVPTFEERYKLWNDLSKRVTGVIRQVDTSKPIIIDSAEYANPGAFDGLEPTGDANSWYSFHWYDPRNFHMQGRPWLPDKATYHYPDVYEGKYWNRETMLRAWRRPLEFAAENKSPLFVGEFGCVSTVPEMEDMVWLLDVISLLDQCNIGWTMYHYLALAHETYWRTYFDCGLFTYDVPEQKLYTFTRKASLLGDLMKVQGNVLRHAQPIDDNILVYAIATPDGKLRIYVSNKSRDEAKSIKLDLSGSQWKPQVDAIRMGKSTDGFTEASPVQMTADRIDLKIMPLNILRLTAEPISS